MKESVSYKLSRIMRFLSTILKTFWKVIDSFTSKKYFGEQVEGESRKQIREHWNDSTSDACG